MQLKSFICYWFRKQRLTTKVKPSSYTKIHTSFSVTHAYWVHRVYYSVRKQWVLPAAIFQSQLLSLNGPVFVLHASVKKLKFSTVSELGRIETACFVMHIWTLHCSEQKQPILQLWKQLIWRIRSWKNLEAKKS